MSEIWLVLAVGAAFFAVVLGGLAVEQSMSDKKRAVRLLESHVSANESVNLRDHQLSENFGQRVLADDVQDGTAQLLLVPGDERQPRTLLRHLPREDESQSARASGDDH